MYIGFEALRRSSDLVSSCMFQWLNGCLQAHPDRGAQWVDTRMTLWLDFGLAPEVAELLARHLQLMWTGKRFLHMEGACWDGDLPGTVAAALFSA